MSDTVEEPVVSEEPASEPASEPAVEEPASEPAVEEPASEPAASVPIEQVASDIRQILSSTPVVSESTEEESPDLSSVSLATLIRVLGQWSSGDIRKATVESELLSGTETDENLDNVEKMLEILKLWIQEGGPEFKQHENYFKSIDTYTLVGESGNWSDEKKQDVLLQIVKLAIDASMRIVSHETILSTVNSF